MFRKPKPRRPKTKEPIFLQIYSLPHGKYNSLKSHMQILSFLGNA